MNSPSSYRAMSPPISTIRAQNFSPQQMASLKDIPIRPLSRYVDHWLELCSGGMIASISAALNNGIQINTVSLVENNRLIRYQASTRLQRLQAISRIYKVIKQFYNHSDSRRMSTSLKQNH